MGKCEKGEQCKFKHEYPQTLEEKDALMKVVMKVNANLASGKGGRSRSASPSGKDKKVKKVNYCSKHDKFLRKKGEGCEDCTDPNCKFPHLTLEQKKKAIAEAKKTAKGKGANNDAPTNGGG